MGNSKKTAPKTNGRSHHTLLAATGTDGPWSIDVEETISGAESWLATIEGPALSFSFIIPSPSVVSSALNFFEKNPLFPRALPGSNEQNGSLRIGTFHRAPVTLLWDDEYADRCFLAIGGATHCLRLTLGNAEIAKLSAALRQVNQELADDQ